MLPLGLTTQPLIEFGGFEEQYHSGKPATLKTWAGSNHGQTLVRLLKIRGAGFKIYSRKAVSLNLYISLKILHKSNHLPSLDSRFNATPREKVGPDSDTNIFRATRHEKCFSENLNSPSELDKARGMTGCI